MTVETIMAELKAKGTQGVKNIFLKHGIKEPLFGVKIQDLKVIQKKVKKNYELSKELYATGNADAMYLAGLIADENKMTKNDLKKWVKLAVSTNISEYTVPWVAAESPFGFELAMDWIDAKEEFIVAAGWSTLSGWVALKPDNELDISSLKKLLKRVETHIRESGNRPRYCMNGFVIAVGCYVASLTNDAIAVGRKISDVEVDMGDTSCKVPDAVTYIMKVKDRGALGKKKKTVRC